MLYKEVSVTPFFAASGSLFPDIGPEAFLWEHFKFEVEFHGAVRWDDKMSEREIQYENFNCSKLGEKVKITR